MSEYGDDIEKYLKGELTSAEMHKLERKALSDPFLADALEGAGALDAHNFSKDIVALNEQLVKRKPASWIWPVRIAASIALLAISAFILWVTLKQQPEQTLALSESKPQQDTITNTPTEKSTASHSPELLEEKPQPVPEKNQHPANTLPGTSAAAEKKSSSSEIIENKSEVITLTENNKANDNVSTPLSEDRLKRNTAVEIDPNKKNEIQPPSAAEIRNAEGYIASIDARPTIVTGRVLSAEDGTPLPNVSVALKGTSVMTKTDAQGKYAITADSRNKTLIYSSVGLESTEVKINGIDSTYLPVKMEGNEETQQQAVVETSGMRNFGPTDVYTIPTHPEIGNRSFKQYLEKNIAYPKEAKEKKIEGRVIIEFKVDATGALSEFKIIRGIGNGCDEEVIRLILQGAKWIPTTKDGVSVSDKARVKFKFELEE